MKSGPVLQGLDLSSSQTDTDLDTPHLTNLWNTLSSSTVSWRKNDLLLALNLVALEHPTGSALNDVAVVALGNLLEKGGHTALGNWLLSSSLSLLLIGTGGNKSSGDHESEKELVCIVCRKEQVRLATVELVVLVLGGWDDNGIADNGSETIYLCAKLDLDNITSLEGDGSLGLVGCERSVWGDKGGWRDGRWVGDTWHTIS